MKSLAVCGLVAILCVAFSGDAWARSVSAGTSGFKSVRRGVFEFGFDNMLLLSNSSKDLPGSNEDSVSNFRATYMGGITPRFFVMDNLSVAINLNLFLDRTGATQQTSGETEKVSAADTGFLGIAMINRYLRLGNSFFFKPGVGVGIFSGSRSVPGIEEGTVIRSDLSGVAAKLDLGVAYYANNNFNLKAGADIVARFGSEKPSEGEDIAFTTLDAGMSVGVGYSF